MKALTCEASSGSPTRRAYSSRSGVLLAKKASALPAATSAWARAQGWI